MNQTFDIHLLKNAVYESASTIKDLREEVKVFSKKHEVDLVTEADLRSEEILINAIKKEFPNDGIISEESETVNSNADRFWVIDPLDGTVNYANDIHTYQFLDRPDNLIRLIHINSSQVQNQVMSMESTKFSLSHCRFVH